MRLTAAQEFLASFGVEIDEAGVTRLQTVLEESRTLAENAAAAFDAAAASIRSFSEEMGLLNLPGSGIAEEGFSGLSGLKLGLDVTPAEKDLKAFTEKAKKPIALEGNGSGLVSAGRSAYNSIQSIFSTPITIRAKVTRTFSGGSGDGDDGGALPRMSSGGRFSKPTDVQVAEDGDAEYIIPVKKENRAVPLLRQLLAELSPAAREQLTGGGDREDLSAGLRAPEEKPACRTLAAGVSAGTEAVGSITQNNQTVSAPVSIQVHSSGADAERIGLKLYDTAERYLLRTLQGVLG